MRKFLTSVLFSLVTTAASIGLYDSVLYQKNQSRPPPLNVKVTFYMHYLGSPRMKRDFYIFTLSLWFYKLLKTNIC